MAALLPKEDLSLGGLTGKIQAVVGANGLPVKARADSR